MIPAVRRSATAPEVRRAPDAAPEPLALFIDPDMPGLDLLVALHDHPLTRHVMLMIVTTRRMVSDKIAGFQAGADDYLVKPVDRELFALHVELLSRLRRRL